MPVPTWDMDLLEEPLDTATVVSEDIWKKFDLDFPLDVYHHDRTIDDGAYFEPLDKSTCAEAREIRHHDCMWAGLCISKEHNRTLPAKKDSQIHKRVPAGRSLLISKAAQQHRRSTKSLESDGDSTRPETPQSSESDTETEEDEVPQFKHDQISINEKLSEYLGENAKAAPVSEVTGQLVRRTHRRQEERMIAAGRQCHVGVRKEIEVRNTLSDHCYHLNQATSKRLEHLGVQTPSDSEEEIDVVTFDKPCNRPATVLPTQPSPTEQQRFQLTVNTALKEKPPPRPRGRPPSNPAKKRGAQVDNKPTKRAKHRTYQKRNTKVAKSASQPNITTVATPSSSKASSSYSRSSSDDEPDTEKRSLHNNMERQRRIDLRNAFEDLRILVPEVEANDKAPKVTILRQAAIYCDMLTEIDETSANEVVDMKKYQEKLRARLSLLRRSFAKVR